MHARLMHQDRDFMVPGKPSAATRGIDQDLELETILTAMAGGDALVHDVAAAAFRQAPHNDHASIRHRQGIMRDAIACPRVIRDLYQLTSEAVEGKRRSYYGVAGRSPTSIVYGSTEVLRIFVAVLRQLRTVAEEAAPRVSSQGLADLFAMLRTEFPDAFFDEIDGHLTKLRFPHGMLVSARLGPDFRGTDYVLHETPSDRRGIVQRLFRSDRSAYTFKIPDRDETGAKRLGELRDHGANLAANALAQAAEHMLGFFKMLRTELAFYVGAIALRERLNTYGVATALPEVVSSSRLAWRFRGLSDVSLVLTQNGAVVPNDLDADGKTVVVITGANQGGKSTFLRSIGQAQIMMQAGLFVTAETFTGPLHTSVLTHYAREEDHTMARGKLEEELSRLDELVRASTPGSLVLFNESFASTNEREGSEIARQVVAALRECGVAVVFVTHLHDFAKQLATRSWPDLLFLRAERTPDGARTFKILPGEPLATSYGEDLYHEVFERDGPVTGSRDE